MLIKWLFGLVFVAVGYFFGKYLGAVTLPIMYYYALQALKKDNQKSAQKQQEVEWACQELGVPPDINAEILQKKRKKLINQFHPDKLSLDASDDEKSRASKRIHEINRSYDVLIKYQRSK